MLITYALIFFAGCLFGALVGDLARKYRQRALAQKLLAALEAGDVGQYAAAEQLAFQPEPAPSFD